MVAASSRLRLLRWPLAIAAAVVVLDQLTKHWAVNALDDGHVIDLVGSLRLKLAFNTGMAFSRGEGIGPFVPILAITVVALTVPLVLIWAPIHARQTDDFSVWSGSDELHDVASSSWSWGLIPLGLGLLIVNMHLLNALAARCGRWSTAWLDDHRHRSASDDGDDATR